MFEKLINRLHRMAESYVSAFIRLVFCAFNPHKHTGDLIRKMWLCTGNLSRAPDDIRRRNHDAS